MNKSRIFSLLSAVSLTAGTFAGAVYAETIRGEVVEVNQNSNYLRINPADQGAGLQKDVRLSVSDGTEFKGQVRSLEDINIGDQITIDADQKDQANWEINSIESAQAAAQQNTGAEQSSQKKRGGFLGLFGGRDDAAQSNASQTDTEASQSEAAVTSDTQELGTAETRTAGTAAQTSDITSEPVKSETAASDVSAAGAPKSDAKTASEAAAGSPTGAELSRKAEGGTTETVQGGKYDQATVRDTSLAQEASAPSSESIETGTSGALGASASGTEETLSEKQAPSDEAAEAVRPAERM